MKACILYYDKINKTLCKELSTALAKGIQEQSHDCDIVDMGKEAGKIISYYDYIGVVTSPLSLWGGKVSEQVASFLKSAGSISGKRSAAFITKGSIRSTKTMQALFKLMEGQGMYLTYSEILPNTGFAKECGKHLKIT
jgi:menaquinone-dependent protoporphyrinogen IX oxidase